MTQNPDCLFCKVINNEVDSYKLYEDESILIILDAFPKYNGHALVIDKNHTRNISEVDFNSLNPKTLETIKNTFKEIVEKLGAQGGYIRSNINEVGGQVVFHTHVHLIPQYEKKQVLKKPEEIYNILRR